MLRSPAARVNFAAAGFLLLLLASAAFAQTSRPADSDSLYIQGSAALAAGDAERAAQLLAEALLRQPGRPEIALRLAEAEAAAGRAQEARRILISACDRHPEETSLAFALARLELGLGDANAAVDQLAPRQSELDPTGLLLLARAQSTAGAIESADQTLEQAGERFPADARIEKARIDLALRRNRPMVALERARRLLAAQRPDPEAHLLMARAYVATGQVLGQTQVRIFPDGNVGQFKGGWLLLEAGARPGEFLCCPPESAMYALRRALDAGLSSPEAHLLHGRLWLAARRPAVAWSVLKAHEAALLEAGPDALRVLCEASLAADVLDEHLRLVRRVASTLPEPQRDALVLRTCLTLADRYGARGDDALHAEFLRRALALDPRDDALRLRLADAEWDRGRNDAAAALYRELLRNRPAHPDRARILGRLSQDAP